MMEFEEFAKAVLTAVREKADGAFSAWITTITKNNGVKMTGISTVSPGSDIGPCVYLESYYEEYRHGCMTLGEAAADVYRQFMEHGNDFKDISVADFLRWETIRHHIYAKLINADMNREMLGMIPHRLFLDLAVVYYVKVGGLEENAGMMSMIIRNNYMEMWGQDEESLYQMAVSNMRRDGEAVFKRMEDILKGIMPDGGEIFADMDLGVKMYVLTNRSRHLGAAELLDRETLRGISEKLSGDFIVLPSSIHETIILPADDEPDYPGLKSMVCTVNATEISGDERLSDHVYRFDRKAGRLEIAA